MSLEMKHVPNGPTRYRDVYVPGSDVALLEALGSGKSRRRSLAVRCLILGAALHILAGKPLEAPPLPSAPGGHSTTISLNRQVDRLLLYLIQRFPPLTFSDIFRSALHMPEIRALVPDLMRLTGQERKFVALKIFQAFFENGKLSAEAGALIAGEIGGARPAQDQHMSGSKIRSLYLRSEDLPTLVDVSRSASHSVQGVILATGLYLLGGGSIPEVFYNEYGAKHQVTVSYSFEMHALVLEIEVATGSNLSQVLRSALLTPDIIMVAKQMADLPKHEKRELAEKVREGLKEKERLSA